MDTTDIITTKNEAGEEVMVGSEIQKKVELWTAVYPQNILLGWYTFNTSVTPQHMHLYNSLVAHMTSVAVAPTSSSGSSSSSTVTTHGMESSGVTQAPIFLLFDTTISKDDIESIPLKVYVREQQQLNQFYFMNKPWKTSSFTVEKIAVNHIINSKPRPKGVTELELQNDVMRTSVQLLGKKVDVIIEVLEAMKEGKIPVDHQLLRRANTIIQSLGTTTSNEEFAKELDEVINNSMLLTFLQGASKNYREMRAYNDIAAMMAEKPSHGSSSSSAFY